MCQTRARCWGSSYRQGQPRPCLQELCLRSPQGPLASTAIQPPPSSGDTQVTLPGLGPLSGSPEPLGHRETAAFPSLPNLPHLVFQSPAWVAAVRQTGHSRTRAVACPPVSLSVGEPLRRCGWNQCAKHPMSSVHTTRSETPQPPHEWSCSCYTCFPRRPPSPPEQALFCSSGIPKARGPCRTRILWKESVHPRTGI